jgi:hypothetical protein
MVSDQVPMVELRDSNPLTSAMRTQGSRLTALPATPRRTTYPQLERGIAREVVGWREGGRGARSGNSLASPSRGALMDLIPPDPCLQRKSERGATSDIGKPPSSVKEVRDIPPTNGLRPPPPATVPPVLSTAAGPAGRPGWRLPGRGQARSAKMGRWRPRRFPNRPGPRSASGCALDNASAGRPWPRSKRASGAASPTSTGSCRTARCCRCAGCGTPARPACGASPSTGGH